MSETTVINIVSRSQNKRLSVLADNYVYVGRPSIFGNPFIIGRDGDRDEVIQKFREYVTSDDPRAIELRKHLSELRGKRLGCYCAPKACHADVLVEMLNDS